MTRQVMTRGVLAATAYLALLGASFIALTIELTRRVEHMPHDGQAFMAFGIFGLLLAVVGTPVALATIVTLRGHGIALPLGIATVAAAIVYAFGFAQPPSSYPGRPDVICCEAPSIVPFGLLLAPVAAVATVLAVRRRGEQVPAAQDLAGAREMPLVIALALVAAGAVALATIAPLNPSATLAGLFAALVGGVGLAFRRWLSQRSGHAAVRMAVIALALELMAALLLAPSPRSNSSLWVPINLGRFGGLPFAEMALALALHALWTRNVPLRGAAVSLALGLFALATAVAIGDWETRGLP